MQYWLQLQSCIVNQINSKPEEPDFTRIQSDTWFSNCVDGNYFPLCLVLALNVSYLVLILSVRCRVDNLFQKKALNINTCILYV